MSTTAYDSPFNRGKIGYRLAINRWRQEPVVKICGALKNPRLRIIDCTAGLGQDALLLAQSGCTVLAFERIPEVAQQFILALKQAGTVSHLSAALTRIQVFSEDAIPYLEQHLSAVDVVYCDPMFPHKSNRSAKSQGHMQELQRLALPPTPEEAQRLLSAALNTATQRVVVKRPKSAPYLADQKPHHSHLYRSCRFDVYLHGKK